MIRAVQGSILDAEEQVIVNPANSFLRHGGGLARVIAAEAIGPVGGDESESLAGYVHGPQDIPRTRLGRDWLIEQRGVMVATGDAWWGSPGHLGLRGFRGIIHAVGPIWAGGDFYEARLLGSAHRSAIRLARDHGCTSIAFPAISCGIFGFPVAEAAPVAVSAAWSAAPRDFDVTFYAPETEIAGIFQKAVHTRAAAMRKSMDEYDEFLASLPLDL